MATTVPRSAFASRGNSPHHQDREGSRGYLRQASTKGSSLHRVPDDKVAVQDPSLLAASQDADSMKYPIDDYNPASKQAAYFDDSFTDFGKSLIDDDYLKGFGLLENRTRNASPNSRLDSRGRSRGASRGTLHPSDAMLAAPAHSVYELDVPHAPFSTQSTPERGGLRPLESRSPNRATPKQSSEMARTRTPEHPQTNGVRKGSAPVIKASPESPVRVKRLSGFSLRSVKSAFSRADFPEVVQPPSPTKPSRQTRQTQQPRQPDNPPRMPPPTPRSADPRREYASPHPIETRGYYNSQFAPRQPRAMVSTPQLHQQIPPSPAVPRPWMTRRPSAGSIRSTMSNVNKPLPPEPGQMQLEMLHPRGPPTPARTPTTPSRTPMTSSPIRGRGEVPPSPANHQFVAPSRRANTTPQVGQLRSRYTPKDLDALDDAFARSTPSSTSANTNANANGVYGMSLGADALDPIKESPNASKQHLDINAPLQIARGPMRMEPSRRPPPTPGSRNRSPAAGVRSEIPTPEPHKQAPHHEHTPSKPVMSRRPSEAQVETSLHLGGGRAKVQQLLGETAQPSEPKPDQERSVDRQLDHNPNQANGYEHEMPAVSNETTPQPPAQQVIFGAPSAQTSQPMTRADSTQMTRSESLSSASGAFRTGSSDVQFNEIRRRLELLSPTMNTDTSFMSSQLLGQMLSTQNQAQGQEQMPLTEHRQQEAAVAEPAPPRTAEDRPIENELPGDSVRPLSFGPVELPTEANWAGGIAGTIAGLYEMAGAASPRVSIHPATPAQLLSEFIPPPIPESPKRDSRVRHSHTQSMLSSGSGRTKSIRSIKSARSARSAKARSITSAAASEIPELYAGLPSPRTTLASRRPSVTWEDEEIPELPPMPEIMTTEELEEMDVISADTAEQVLYQILRNLMDPRDLFNASLVSRGFQRTFTRHDTKLLRNSLWYTSPPAWEYLEMHMPISPESGQLEYPPEVYRQQWVHSMRCLTKLKGMILHHCGRSLSPLTALMLDTKANKHSSPVDDAIWRIWTFCKIFGEDENRREDLELQKQWIKGHTIVEAQARNSESRTINAQEYPAFGFGNDEGLSPEELMRIGEIWLCLRVLVRGYRGQRREARDFGIFEGAYVPVGDAVTENAILDEWTIHLLSLAPGTNLEVLCPQKATQENFITAESLGFTSWTPPGRNFTSSGFLTGPICSVLEEWLSNDARKNVRASHDEGSVHPAFRSQQVFPSRQQVGLFVDRLRTVKDVLIRPQSAQKSSAMPGSSGSQASTQSMTKTPKTPKLPKPMQVEPQLGPSKSVKESSKKAGFAGFSSKLSLRLPSRSLTTVHKSKLQLPTPDRRPSSAESLSAAKGVEPASPTESIKASGFFSRSKSTHTKSRIFSRSATKGKRNNEPRTPGPTNLTAPSLEIPPVPSSREGSRGNPVAGAKSRPTSIVVGHDKLPVYPDTPGVAAEPGASNPGALARSRLIALGYDPDRVDAVVAEVSTEYGVDFERAVKKLKKSKKLEDRLQRLDRMG